MLLNKFFSYLLLVFVIISFSFIVVKHISLYLQKFDWERLDNLYKHSQFALSTQNRQEIIQDEDLYAYSGWYYLKTGNLDTINIEHPPLGKYLIGLSILFFNNQNIGQILWAVVLLVLLFLMGKKLIGNQNLSLLAILLFSCDGLFKDQIIHSLLDLPLAVMVSLFFFITVYGNTKKPLTIFMQGLVLGMIAAIKYPTIALLVFILITIYYLMQKEKNIIYRLFQLALIASMIFLLSYLPFFIKNPSLLTFYNFQLKALKIHLSHVPEYPKFQVFNVLLFDKWLSWWGDKNFIPSGYWNIFWPILTINYGLSLIFNFRKFLLINLWTLSYLIFLATRLFFPRYLFLLMPFLYLNLCYNFKSIYLNLRSKL